MESGLASLTEAGLVSFFTANEPVVSSFGVFRRETICAGISLMSSFAEPSFFSSFAFVKYASIRCAFRKRPKLSADEGEAR